MIEETYRDNDSNKKIELVYLKLTRRPLAQTLVSNPRIYLLYNYFKEYWYSTLLTFHEPSFSISGAIYFALLDVLALDFQTCHPSDGRSDISTERVLRMVLSVLNLGDGLP